MQVEFLCVCVHGDFRCFVFIVIVTTSYWKHSVLYTKLYYKGCLFVCLFVFESRLFVLLLVELLIIIYFSWSLFYEIVLIKQCGQIIGQTILQQWWFPRYNWYMVESGAKHHNTDPNPNPCTSLKTITYQTLRRKTISVGDCLQLWNMHWTGQRWTQPDTDKIFER